jgi:hypothetical protein
MSAAQSMKENDVDLRVGVREKQVLEAAASTSREGAQQSILY